MKKKLFCFFVFTIMLLPMYSAPYSSELSRAISLQGAYGEVVSIEFEEIAAQTQSYLIGMPFNIQDQSVQSDSGAGRVISRWNIIANTPFYLKLSCDGLYHENYSEIENYSPLQFDLRFTFDLGYFINSVEKSEEGEFTYSSGSQSEPVYLIPDGAVPDSGAFIGSVDGLVYFKFTSYASNTLDDDNSYPPGKYHAEVKVEVFSE